MNLRNKKIILYLASKYSRINMPKIYDNQEYYLTKGLNETLELSHRADFCVGYFNLRGWKEVADKIDGLSGELISENDVEIHYVSNFA